MNANVSALRFFFAQTLDRPDLVRKLPGVLSQDEVARLLAATTCLKHQAALSVPYSPGLRASDIAALKVRDIDSERMLLRVERDKGGRYRNAMLPAGLLALLREWWRVGRREGVLHIDGWLFPGQNYLKPISTRQLHRIVVEASLNKRPLTRDQRANANDRNWVVPFAAAFDRGCVKTSESAMVLWRFGRLGHGPFRTRGRSSAGLSAACIA